MMEEPASIQFTTEATTTPFAFIMKLIYGHTLDPKDIPNVSMKNIMAMQVTNRILSFASVLAGSCC